MDIDLIQLNYDLLQALICVFEFDYIIRSINFLKQWLFFIQDTNDDVEFFLVFFDIFLTLFNTTQSRYPTKNGYKKATNICLIAKPNHTMFNIITINPIQASFTRLISVHTRTSIVFNITLCRIREKFKRKSCLDLNNHQIFCSIIMYFIYCFCM